MNQNNKHIVVSQQNFERLKNFGSFVDSFDDIISKILEKVENYDTQ